jgi:hypothetical protein
MRDGIVDHTVRTPSEAHVAVDVAEYLNDGCCGHESRAFEVTRQRALTLKC